MTLKGRNVFIDRPEIVYPESDGKPMADNTLQAQWIVLLYGNIKIIAKDNPNIFVAADHFWYPIEGNPKIRVAPDVMVVFGRPNGHRGSYRQWIEDNVAPQVAFEVLSPSNSVTEMVKKLAFYEQYGVEEYVVLDPDRESFVAYQRMGDSLEIIAADGAPWTSARLGMSLVIEEGKVRALYADGKPFKTYKAFQEEVEMLEEEIDTQRLLKEIADRNAEAERQKAEAEREKAEAERQKAEAERERAEAERLRAEKALSEIEMLKQQLRDLGIED